MPSAVLTTTIDPRDQLQKAHRSELFAFAQANNVTEIDHDGMPADLMRAILRQKGLTNIAIPKRTLGQPEPRPILNSNGKPLTVAAQTPAEKVVEVDATSDLARQYAAERQARNNQPAPKGNDRWKNMTLAEMGINELRWAAKAHGMTLARKTTKAEMLDFLRGKGLK